MKARRVVVVPTVLRARVVRVSLGKGEEEGEEPWTEEELDWASIAASYMAYRLGLGEPQGGEWRHVEGDVEWLSGQGRKMVEGGYPFLNEPDFGPEDLAVLNGA